MNKLELRYYIQNGGIIDASIATPQALLNRVADDQLFANTAFPKLESNDGMLLSNFFEFFIDGTALSKLLNEYQYKA